MWAPVVFALSVVGRHGHAPVKKTREHAPTSLTWVEGGGCRGAYPIGLDIGSKTPLEITVAIMAQLVQLRRPAKVIVV